MSKNCKILEDSALNRGYHFYMSVSEHSTSNIKSKHGQWRIQGADLGGHYLKDFLCGHCGRTFGLISSYKSSLNSD